MFCAIVHPLTHRIEDNTKLDTETHTMGPTPHYYDEKGADDAAMWLCGNRVGRRQVGQGAAAKGTSSRGMTLLHHDEGVRVVRPSASVGNISSGGSSNETDRPRVFASVPQGVKGKPELGGDQQQRQGRVQSRRMNHSDSFDSLASMTLPTPRQEDLQRPLIHNARWTEKTIPRRRYRPSERAIGGTRRAAAAFSESSMGHGNVITWGGDETKGGGGVGGGGSSRDGAGGSSALRSSASASLVQRTPFALDSVNEPTFVRVSRYG